MAFVRQVLLYLEMASQGEACPCFLVRRTSPAWKSIPLDRTWSQWAATLGLCLKTHPQKAPRPLSTPSWLFLAFVCVGHICMCLH